MHSVTQPDANVGARLDTSALRGPIDPDALRSFRLANRPVFGWTQARVLRMLRDSWSVLGAVLWIVFIANTGLFFLFTALAAVVEGDTVLLIVAGWITVPIAAILTGLVTTEAARRIGSRAVPRPRLLRSFRLTEFADDNGFGYVPLWASPRLEGALFAAGERRISRDVIASADGSVEIGNHTIAGGDLSSRARRRFGWIRIELPEALPHMVLEARANRSRLGRAEPPWRIGRGQRLRLEGDFDRFFALHVPEGYERDALRLFTPDVMALLIDRLRTFDAEVVDRALFLYTRAPFDMTAPATFHRAFAAADAIRRPTERFASRWRDEHRTRSMLAWQVRGRVIRPALGVAFALGWVALLVVRLATLH